MHDFHGKTAVVTGAASGIGLGMAKALAGAGMNLALCDLRPDPLEQARRTIEALGVTAIGIPADVSDPASVAAAGEAIANTFGKLHICVNNAGVAMHGTPVEQVQSEEWNWVIGVNVMGVINGIRTFVPMIRAHGECGHVVNTASISGFFLRGGRHQGAYSMTKYAVVGLSEALEQELEGSGIGISVLSPGAVRTGIFESAATRGRKGSAVPTSGRSRRRCGGRFPRRRWTRTRWAGACCGQSGTMNFMCSRIPGNATRYGRGMSGSAAGLIGRRR